MSGYCPDCGNTQCVCDEMTASADRDGESVWTVGDALSEVVASSGVWLGSAGVEDACRKLNLDPSTPLANVVTLGPDDCVVNGLIALDNGWWSIDHIVRSPVQPGSEGEG